MSDDKTFIYEDKYFKKLIDGEWVYVGIHSIGCNAEEVVGPDYLEYNVERYMVLEVWTNEYDSEGYIKPPGSIRHGDFDIKTTYQNYLDNGFEEFIPEWEPKGLR